MNYFFIIDNKEQKQVASLHALNGMYAIIRYCKETQQEVNFQRFNAFISNI